MAEPDDGVDNPQRSIERVAEPELRAGPFVARLARDGNEVRQAQALRYRVLLRDSGGQPGDEADAVEADIDEWDDIASHIIVRDTRSDDGLVVGTLRLVSSRELRPGQSFYTEHAFDVSALRSRFDHLIELGRFCVDPETRNGIVLGLIWKLAAQLIIEREADALFGCASFAGADVNLHLDALAFLYRECMAPEELNVTPRIAHVRLSELNLPPAAGSERSVPTLVRGYLKLGARSSDAAIVDAQFNTTFVCLYADARAMIEGQSILRPR
ncbi:MAG: GNAT family N-acyltransferase [Pseudomonadota bacterium]